MKWMLPDEYYEGITYIPILALAFVGRTIYHINSAEIFYLEKTRFVSVITITGLIVNIIVSLLLVKTYGVLAICWSFSLSFTAWAITSYIYKVKISVKKEFMFINEILVFLGITSIASVLGFILNSYLFNN